MKIYDAQGRQVTTNEIETLEFYDTGWIACNVWTNQHLGTTLGNDVAHSLSAPLRNLIVKVFLSTDGTDANSHELLNTGVMYNALGYRGFNYHIYGINDNSFKIQTGDTGLAGLNDDGSYWSIDNEADYYRIVVYKMVTVPRVYSGIPKYDTGWINRNLWGNKHLGSSLTKNLDSNVTHNLNTPLSDLMVKLLVSPTGVDGDSFELIVGADDGWGVTVYYVDANNILVQTGANGIIYINATGGSAGIDTEDWYYKIKVYKLTAQPPAITTSRVRVTKDDAQTMTDNTPEAVEYDDVDFDSLGEWDISTWKFTAKNAGYYQINACVLTSDAIWTLGDLVHLSLWKNGARFSYLDRKELLANTENVLASGSDIVYLNGTTDYIQIYCWINRGANTDLINNALFNYVSIHRS